MASSFFDRARAAEYDQRFAKLAPLRDALHLLTAAALARLPGNARVLSVGAGTGAEILALAPRFPGWRFVAVDPSGPMLEIARERAEERGISTRCEFHVGTLDSLPDTELFDGATSILVSQFVLDPEARIGFFREIAGRLRPGGRLVSADLAADLAVEEGQEQLSFWLGLLRTEQGISAEQADNMRTAYAENVAVLPVHRVEGLLVAGGFENPVRILQTGMIHAWTAYRKGDDPSIS